MNRIKMAILVIIYISCLYTVCLNTHGYEVFAAEDSAYTGVEFFLADIDYLMQFMEENFALFDVAYWARGIDINELADNARQAVTAAYMGLEEGYSIADYEFFGMLYDAFEPLSGLAHFAIGVGSLPFQRFVNTTDFTCGEWQAETLDVIQEMSNFLAFRYSEGEMAEITSRLALAVKDGSVADDEELLRVLFSFIIVHMHDIPPERVTARSIEEGRIAYIEITDFPLFTDFQYLPFFQSISDYEHLIIDLRRNPGGQPNYFYQNLMRPNISEILTADALVFFTDGEHAMRAGHHNILGNTVFHIIDRMASVYEVQLPIAEMLKTYDLPELRVEDMERMSYGFRARTVVHPRIAGGEPIFGGRIWILTGEITGSAAQIVSWFTKETGFATLVGDITGGNFGGAREHFYLPNTGVPVVMDIFYVTDMRGRPLEAGTVPHYFNRYGMDALETVLAIIGESTYESAYLGADFFLDDIDHLVRVLEENFALFDAAYWARGVDIHGLAEAARAAVVEAGAGIDKLTFAEILRESFQPLWGLAHFGFAFDTGAWFSVNALDLACEEFQAELIAELEEMFLLWNLPNELLEEFTEAIASGDKDRLSELSHDLNLRVMHMPPPTHELNTYIVEEGRIALLDVRGFPVNSWRYSLMYMDFFSEIRDFEHLIIDFRNNTGGFPDYFYQNIVRPNISYSLTAYAFSFFQDGEYTWRGPWSLYNFDRMGFARPVGDILAEYCLPELRREDMERMSYGFRTRTTVNARILVNPREGQTGGPAFGGRIWILTGERTGSGGQIASWFAREAGFATLVGDVTGGNFGGLRTEIRLPNTGLGFQFDVHYVTDERGRPLEAGTVPHYFNRYGMDALETVLAVIDES